MKIVCDLEIEFNENEACIIVLPKGKAPHLEGKKFTLFNNSELDSIKVSMNKWCDDRMGFADRVEYVIGIIKEQCDIDVDNVFRDDRLAGKHWY